MILTEQDILKIAELAKIKIETHETEKYKFELLQIFKMIEELQTLKIDNNTEIYNFSDNCLSLRKDEIRKENISDLVLGNAAKKEFGCFVVPKVRE